jgi:hypothetical protein
MDHFGGGLQDPRDALTPVAPLRNQSHPVTRHMF